MADPSVAAQEFAELAKNLIAVGEGGLRRELYKAINDAAQPLADKIRGAVNLEDHMPNRYAAVLARDLKVTTHKNTSIGNPGVTLLIRAPTFGRGGRKVRQREDGVITHPLFGDKERWFVQTKGMVAGFVHDPVSRAGPLVRDKILEAVHRAENQALGRP